MHKPVVTIGNSLGMTLDTFTCRRLGITRESVLHVRFEAKRLIVEVSKEQPTRKIEKKWPKRQRLTVAEIFRRPSD